MENSITDAVAERDALSKKLAELRQQVQLKRNTNENIIAINTEQEYEVERMCDYAKQLQDNLENLTVDYNG